MMSQVEQASQLPAPNLTKLTPDEFSHLEMKIHQCMECLDIEGLAKLAPIYPISAELLDLYKRTHGIECMIRTGFNLTKAVDKYGMSWIEY